MHSTPPPANIQTLAAQYQLGAPLRAHRRPITLLPTLAAGIVSVPCLIFGGLLIFILLRAPRFQPSMLVLCMLALLVGLVLLGICLSRLRYRRFRAWECDAGFLELNERGAVSGALRWDQIQTVWHRVKASNSARSGTSYEHRYSIQGPSGKEITLNYPDLWQRIENEFVRQHLPQALASINAGSVVSFGGVVVSAQGIASGPVVYTYFNRTIPNGKPPWQVPWQAIPWITVNNSIVEFTPPVRTLASYQPPTFASLSDVPNLCLLRALAQTISNGRIQWIEKKRRWASVENSSPPA